MPNFAMERNFLRDLEPDLAARVYQATRSRRLPKGGRIHERGDRHDNLTIIRSGLVRLSTTDANGETVAIAHLGPNETFGMFSLMLGKPKGYDADAGHDTHLLVLDRPAFRRLLDEEPAFRDHVFAFLARRLALVIEALEDGRSRPLKFRAAKLLLANATPPGRVPLTQTALAEELGASRYGVSLALKEMAGAGLIRQHYGSIEIRDEEALGAWLANG